MCFGNFFSNKFALLTFSPHKPHTLEKKRSNRLFWSNAHVPLLLFVKLDRYFLCAQRMIMLLGSKKKWVQGLLD